MTDPPPPQDFPLWRTLALPLLASGLMLGWFGWDRYRDRMADATVVTQVQKAEQLRGQILLLAKVQQMSALMFAGTGDLQWEDRYRKTDPEQALALNAELALRQGKPDAQFVAQALAADHQLDADEARAFGRVRTGDLPAARAILSSRHYESNFAAYTEAMGDLEKVLDQDASNEANELREDAANDLGMTVAGALLLFALWWRVLYVMQWGRRSLARSNALLVQKADELDCLSQGLNQQVEERTRDLTDAANASMNMMQDATLSRERVEQAFDALNREMEVRKRLERESRDLGSMIDNAHDAIFVCDMDQRVLSWNTGAAQMYGWSADEAIGRDVVELLYDDPDALRGVIALLHETDDWKDKLIQKRKDGSPITVNAHKTLFRDEQGRPKSILAINTDITAQLALEERIQQSQRLDALGQLTGGVAHDFNNLLTVIYGNSELLVELLEAQPRLRELAAMTMSAAQRGADLTHRLLAFARRQPLESAVVDVNRLLANMAALLSRTLSEAIAIEIIHGTGLWPIVVDASQLESAILNLAINARDAMSGGGRLIVETSNILIDDEYASGHSGLVAGRYVLLSVSDTGIGIRREDIQRVFEPFFTTKEFGKGTGLGLSMIYGFVMQSRGHVSIYSEPGQGTTVKIYLPIATGTEPRTEDIHLPDLVVGGHEAILLVEDDEPVRRIGEAQLRILGYQVVSVADGAQALDILRKNREIDLVFTDMVMPGGMSGTELAQAALAIRPGLPVLYTSGYVQGNADGNDSMPAGAHFLSKPYSRAALAAKIRALLAVSSASDNGEQT